MNPRRLRWSTAARLTAFLGAMLAVVLGLALTGLLRAFAAQSDASTTRALVAELRAFAVAAQSKPPAQGWPQFAESYLRTRVLPDGETLSIALRGEALVGSAGSEPVVRSALVRGWAELPPPTGTKRHLDVGGQHYLVVAAPLVVGGRTDGMVAAAADLAQTAHDVARVRALAIGEAVIALLAGCLGSYVVLRRLLRRIGRITATAADLGSGALDRRLRELDHTDEVGELATTFDVMADQLSTTLRTQRRLLSDVSHQLRTPLTVARGHLEVLDRTSAAPVEVRETVAVVLDEIDHMRALVERLLMLGRAMEPDFLAPEPVDLRSFCADLVESARVMADRRWGLAPVPDIVVDVDAAKLRGALLNLIDNAVKATRTGDAIAVTTAYDGGALVTLAVEDSGPGIPPERRQAVLERFARPGAADSDGSGLGLAIVRAVAEAHGGSVTVTDSALGGARVALALPVAAPGPEMSSYRGEPDVRCAS